MNRIFIVSSDAEISFFTNVVKNLHYKSVFFKSITELEDTIAISSKKPDLIIISISKWPLKKKELKVLNIPVVCTVSENEALPLSRNPLNACNDFLFLPVSQTEFNYRIKKTIQLKTVSRGYTFEADQNSSILIADNGLLDSNNFYLHLKREWLRCHRYNWFITILCIGLKFEKEFMQITQKQFHSISNKICNDIHRPGDAARFNSEKNLPVWEIVLSETDESGCEHVIERLQTSLKSGYFQDVFDHKSSKYIKLYISAFTCQPREVLARSPNQEPAFLQALETTRNALDDCVKQKIATKLVHHMQK